ncbi:MAG: chitobiase/beta-hexosaminidase C-terminal domain-containing protein [Nitrospinae bacterium]|nr:chitobiase/beta-hexosaminidase C-terminal domain-containing protein [Nitrospinota bacterium]
MKSGKYTITTKKSGYQNNVKKMEYKGEFIDMNLYMKCKSSAGCVDTSGGGGSSGGSTSGGTTGGSTGGSSSGGSTGGTTGGSTGGGTSGGATSGGNTGGTTTSDTTAPATTASPSGGSFTSAQSVTLTCSDSGSGCYQTFYTTDGSTPSTLSTVYATPITISATTILKYFSVDVNGNTETVKAETYAISATTTGNITVTDIDGNVYNTVTIGAQTWMKENLKVTKYRDGTAIPTTTADISAETSPKYQWAYNATESNASIYGRLYTWHAATDSRGLCPAGWHLPTDSEWTTLENYLGGSSVAGGKMKEAGTTHWASPNTGADNSSGFTALPGGYRHRNGTFSNVGYYGFLWSATGYSSAGAWRRDLYYGDGIVYRSSGTMSFGSSVRCAKD